MTPYVEDLPPFSPAPAPVELQAPRMSKIPYERSDIGKHGESGPHDEAVGAVGTNLEAKRVGNAGIGGAIDVDGITVPFFKGETRKGLRLLYGPKVSAKGLFAFTPRRLVFSTSVL